MISKSYCIISVKSFVTHPNIVVLRKPALSHQLALSRNHPTDKFPGAIEILRFGDAHTRVGRELEVHSVVSLDDSRVVRVAVTDTLSRRRE